MICRLTSFGLVCFTTGLALGFEIVSPRKTWKPLSNLAVDKDRHNERRQWRAVGVKQARSPDLPHLFENSA